MQKLFRPLLLGAAFASFLASCSKDDNTTPTAAGTGQYAFVINEGNFSNGTGSVSRVNKSNVKDIAIDAFGSANGGAVLGSVVESMTVVDTKGYVVVNNSNKIEVVSLPDFKSTATIAGLNQPRFLTRSVANTNRGYVTEWLGGPYPAPYTAGRISLIDLSSNKVTGTVPVGINPERMALTGGNLYVANSSSSFLTVISDASGAATGTIALPTPASSLVVDKNNTLWVLCGSDYASQPAKLLHFSSGATPAVQQTFTFATVGSGGGLRIGPDGQQLYYSYRNGEYRMAITDTSLPTTPLIRRNFYGFDIDPSTGLLYGTDALNYSNPGWLIRYQPNGTKLDSVTVQVSPNGVVFY
ncbi:hypothetical protein HHL22_18250 [Hymenobacter sp. RP-2-7]|uniref:YncE family protein n=1 Tax=Hymenobacter polaris TaxID=2682546 RepID=A0A7Y0AH05_9BACT|nr:DUF5074 domain-containing protein [Hymenobacter polaris]NML67150.1 hypothetical protein [Hymenobacter polaris]